MYDGMQVARQVNITYECIMLMGTLQRRQGRFTYDELAERLSRRMHLPLPYAQRAVVDVVAKIDRLCCTFYDGSMQFIEPPTPTIEQTIAEWKTMMAAPQVEK